MSTAHGPDPRYDAFVATSPQGTMFATSWWLNAVAPGKARIALAEDGGVIRAAWPYVLRGVSWPVRIEMPPLTPWLGILFEPPGPVKRAKLLGRQKDLSDALLAELPAYDVLRARFHPGYDYWSPLHWKGFVQTTRYTFILDGISDTSRVWDGFRDNVRTDIRKAERLGVVVETLDDPREFWRVQAMSFERQGIPVPYDEALFNRVDAACSARNCRRMLGARDASGAVHAVAYIVWDARSAYYLIGGGDPELRNSGATAAVMWEAIQFAATVAPRFDFEGSMLEPVERFVRSFGGAPVPYHSFEHTPSKKLAILKTLRGLAHELRQLASA